MEAPSRPPVRERHEEVAIKAMRDLANNRRLQGKCGPSEWRKRNGEAIVVGRLSPGEARLELEKWIFGYEKCVSPERKSENSTTASPSSQNSTETHCVPGMAEKSGGYRFDTIHVLGLSVSETFLF
jgi:hypothetical protein